MKMVLGARTRSGALALAASLWALGCGLENASPPTVTGPSEFGLSVTASAVPEILPRDGTSQSEITLNVRDAQNRPDPGRRFTLSVTPSAATLSVAEVTTDVAGVARFTVTAPSASALAGNVVTIQATPIVNTSGGAVARTIEVRLSGAANTTVPTPSFTVTPASPEVGQVTTFDASASRDEGAACLDACTYTWTLGTEGTKTGRIITHAFQTPGIHSVTLTMTDAAGTSASAQQNITVTAAARPTVTFPAPEPAAPVAGQPATFTATSTVAANHRITRFEWTWGDGSSNNQTSNASLNHTFSTAGTYVVTVTVTDDLGQTASFTRSVTVGSGVTASFTFSPSNPKIGDTVQFNGSPSTSTGSATITEWTWDFGDGTTETKTVATTTHVFQPVTAVRTFRVRLTVKDSAGRTGTTTQDVAVAAL